jgi:DNA primase
LPKYSRETVRQVRAANDIIEVIGNSVQLRQQGGAGRFVGLCPFHPEKTPSFHVTRERQRYYCFGCERGGDAISFVREHEGLVFVEALRKLADRAGIRLPAPTERESREDYLRSSLIQLGSFAARFFADLLKDPLKGGQARAYLKKTRQLQDETIRRFGLGYAPDAWQSFRDAARAAGYKDGVMDASGLVKVGQRGTHYDVFRNRLMIPIRDVAGNVVAFGGRDLGGETQAKYINSPETALYKKGRVLYGLCEAREALRREKRALLVEGYFDLMRCFDAGIENVVATCGTALTPEQASLIRRYVPEVVVVFDGDAAGVKAALRGMAILTAAGLTVRALLLPEKQDPDDYIRREGADAFRLLVEQAQDVVTFYVAMNEERLGTIEGRTGVAKEVLTIVQGIEDTLRVDEYLKRTARVLQLDEWSVRREFNEGRQQRDGAAAPSKPAEEKRSRVRPEDRDFLAALMSSEPFRELARKELAGSALPVTPFTTVLKAVLYGEEAGFVDFEDEAASQLYAAAANRHDAWTELGRDLVEKRLLALRREALLAEEDRLAAQMRDAAKSNDRALERELALKRVGINREIDRLGRA